MSVTLQELIDAIGEDPTQVRSALELIKRGTLDSGSGDESLPDALDNRWISKYTTDQLSTATSLRAGNLVRTPGYYASGDGGGNDFIVEEQDGSTEDGGSIIFIAGTSLQLRGLFPGGLVYARQFGAKLNGVKGEDDAAAAAALAYGAKEIHFPYDGTLNWGADAAVVPNNTKIFGHGCIVLQTNFDNTATISDGDQYAGWALPENPTNIKVKGFDIRGPWYQVDVTPTYRSIGIAVKGRYDAYFYDNPNYPANPPSLLAGAGLNVCLIDNKIDGFGQSGIIADNIDWYFSIWNKITNCGRDGERHYGVQKFFVKGAVIDKMAPGFPGEGAAPNFNVYGYSATRVYHSTSADGSTDDYRPTAHGVVSDCNVDRCWTWKSLDTHGGHDIVFSNNICVDSYIGLGIDKGGFTLADGYAPPRRITSIGNVYRNTADAPYQRAGIFAVAHDFTAENRGEDLKSIGDTIDGFGEDNRDGGLVVSNFKGAVLSGFSLLNCLRAAMNFQGTVEDLVIGGGTIRDTIESSTGTAFAINTQSANVRGTVDNVTISQDIGTSVDGIATVSPAAGYGLKVGSGMEFQGNVNPIISPAHLRPCEFLTGVKAVANVNLNASSATLAAGSGITSVTRLSTGVVRFVLSSPATNAASIFTDISAKGGAAKTHAANPVSTTEIDVTIADSAGAPQDVGFTAKFSYY